MMIDRNVGLQTAPSDDGMYAEQGRSRGWMRQRDGSTLRVAFIPFAGSVAAVAPERLVTSRA